jgi:hypothetical protein
MMKISKRPRCYGTHEHPVHAKGCRIGRPACPMRRKEAGHITCDCPAYPFPHRAGSGICNPLKRNEAMWGPTPAAEVLELPAMEFFAALAGEPLLAPAVVGLPPAPVVVEPAPLPEVAAMSPGRRAALRAWETRRRLAAERAALKGAA